MPLSFRKGGEGNEPLPELPFAELGPLLSPPPPAALVPADLPPAHQDLKDAAKDRGCLAAQLQEILEVRTTWLVEGESASEL